MIVNPIVQNILWTLEQVSAFVAEAKLKPLKHRSRYYKAGFFFMASSVEALEFILVKNFCLKNSIEHRSESKYVHMYTLPEHLIKSVQGNIGIYEERKIKFEWKNDIDWHLMNEICLKYKIFDKRFFNKLDKIRNKRNCIHIQSLNNKDHKYTKKDIEYVGSILPKLIDKLSSYVVS